MSKDFLDINKEDIKKMSSFMDLTLIKLDGLYFWLNWNRLKNIKYLYYNKNPLIDSYEKELYNLSKSYKNWDKLYISYKYNSNFIFSTSTNNDINKAKKNLYSWEVSIFNIIKLDRFFDIYKRFFINKWLNHNDKIYFERLVNVFWNNLFILDLYKDTNIIGSVILLKFTDKIIPMFWWYEGKYIKKWLKYFTNNFIIDYFRECNNINEIIFWTWKVDSDLKDSLFLFKKKFWEINVLRKI